MTRQAGLFAAGDAATGPSLVVDAVSGLDAGSVSAAVERVRPAGVDASSRLESAPGAKDPARIAAFVRAALARADRPEYRPTVVDTAALARRLLRDEVPNCKLSTLASRLRLDHTPTHRALDDALATTDLLHLLLERAAGLGVASDGQRIDL